MFRTFKRDQRLIQTLRLPVSLLCSPVARMRGEAIHKLMVTQVLRGLIAVTRAWAETRRAHERKPQGVIIGFVGSVLAICQHRDAESAALVSQIDPLMRRHFEFLFVIR